jgi:soluble lytic murein transglycosylase-like protein
LEIELIKLRSEFEKLNALESNIQIDMIKTQKRQLENSYDRYVDSLDVYRKALSDEEKIILRMARRFGECEINMPDGFVQEVTAYIRNWQSSRRLANVIARAKRNHYIPAIVRTMAEQELPAQFLYLAIQESNLDHRAVGPPTRFGIAKGMWQFIPATGEKYGLRIGPLKDEAKLDLLDERHDFRKSTAAAARYLRDIYTTDAQASGLLVMASYNWGEHRVLDLIRSLPANPRDRNFWKMISTYRHKIPEETYDYVFSIFSAAVIGENPPLFGFDFDNPLSQAN